MFASCSGNDFTFVTLMSSMSIFSDPSNKEKDLHNTALGFYNSNMKGAMKKRVQALGGKISEVPYEGAFLHVAHFLQTY